MKKTGLLFAALLLVGATLPAAAQRYDTENTFRVHAGEFQPDGESQYWDENFLDFTGDVTNFDDFVIAFDYTRRVTSRTSVLVGGMGYEGQATQAYRDFVGNDGFDILHETTLDVQAFNLGLKFDLVPSRAKVVPYVGAGIGAYAWELEEDGEFIDFGVIPNETFFSNFLDDGVAFGYFVMAGVDLSVGPNWSVFAEGRWHDAEGELEGDFDGFGDVDLSGRSVTAGISWNF